MSGCPDQQTSYTDLNGFSEPSQRWKHPPTSLLHFLAGNPSFSRSIPSAAGTTRGCSPFNSGSFCYLVACWWTNTSCEQDGWWKIQSREGRFDGSVATWLLITYLHMGNRAKMAVNLSFCRRQQCTPQRVSEIAKEKRKTVLDGWRAVEVCLEIVPRKRSGDIARRTLMTRCWE